MAMWSELRRHKGIPVALYPPMDQLFSSIRVLDATSIYAFERPANTSTFSGDLLRHPFLVTIIDDERYLLLEDAALFDQVVATGVHHIPALICAPDELRITCPTLVLTDFSEGELRHLTAHHPDQICLDTPGNAANFYTVHLTFVGQPTTTVYLRHSSRTGCSAALDLLFAAFGDSGRYYPLFNAIQDRDSLVRFNVGGTLLTMPDVTLADLKAAATSGNIYPPRIVTVQPFLRVYNIDMPMTVLRAENSVEDKSKFLHELIALRLQSQRTSQFSGQVYILNR